MSGFVSGLFKLAGRGLQQISAQRQFHAIASVPHSGGVAVSPATNQWSLDSVRTVVRNFFPKPRERKRVKQFGWKARLATVAGRRVIMRRILKGRWYLTH